MFENPRRGRQASNFTRNVPKILHLKSSSEQIFSENCRWVPLSSGTSEIHPDCGITVRSSGEWICPMSNRICCEFKQIELNWNRIVHQNALWSLVFSNTRPWNKQISAPEANQPSSQERWQVADLKAETFEDVLYLFSSDDKYKGFSLYQREDWLIDWNQLQLCQFSVHPSLSLLPVVWSQRSMNFLKIQVIQDKSKPTRVAMVWLRVKVNRTRLCTAATSQEMK